MRVVSMRGEAVDVARYLAQNEKQVAIGNAKMNARGDIVGSGGQIVKAREAIAAEYHRANPKAVKHVSLKDISSEAIMTPAEAVEKALAAQKAATEAAAPAPAPKGKRRITETD